MEFTVWEESQRRNATDFVDPWDSERPFGPDTATGYEELDPHDAGSPRNKQLADDFDDFHREASERSFILDDPSIHVPSGFPRADFVGPGDLHRDVRESSTFDEGDSTGRGHKRELSEAFTMHYPLVSPSHGDSYGHAGPRTMLGTGDTSPDLSANMMRTPVRDFSSYPFDSMRINDSPSYPGAGLESPLESLALQSPYMAGQPFPALPRVQEHLSSPEQRQEHSRYLSNSPRQPQRRNHHLEKSHLHQRTLSSDSSTTASKSDSIVAEHNPSDKAPVSADSQPLSQSPPNNKAPANAPSQEAGPTVSNPTEATPERGPQTPRASASKSKQKSRRTPSSVTPRTGEATQTTTPTPNQDGRRDSRKRIAKEQIEILEAFFHKNPRPEREDRMRLSSETNLEPRTVQIWFQNRRAKSRSMKMPPSQADNSMFAQQYRAAAAAASNAAAAAAGAQPMVGVGPNGHFPVDRTPTHGDAWSMAPGHQQRMMVSPAGSRQSVGYGVFQPQQRVFTGHGSPPPHAQSMGRYHQQLGGKPMYSGPQGMQGVPPGMQYHNTPPMHSMQQVPMAPNQGPGSQLMPAMLPPNMGHGRSMSAYEPFVNGYGPGPADYEADGNIENSMMYTSKTGSTASLNSVGSSYGLPQSPLNNELMMEGPPPVYSPGLQSLQNSPEMNSPITAFPAFYSGRAQSMSEEPVPLSRSQSAHSFGDAWPRAAPMGEMKRRRSLYGAVPTWGWADHNAGAFMHTSPPRTPSLSSTNSSTGSTGGTLAASAAAAALRTRNRSSTQPAPRSRQPSIRLQLDESNHSATLVVLPQDNESQNSAGSETGTQKSSGMTPRNSNERLGSSREMSPERAERAAERLLAERAAAATMGNKPTRSAEK